MNILFRYITKSLEWTKFPGHSAEWKSWCVWDILHHLGLTVHAVNWKGTPRITQQYDAVFDVSGFLDLDPAFADHTVKILHLTGSDNTGRNRIETERVNQVNARRGCNLGQRRRVGGSDAVYQAIEQADLVIFTGNQTTLETYPKKYRDKMRLIDTVATMVEE